ncbi:diaminohydroxyphosphoribosylaminopyrimidine deaminase/5-amino-6-(5-phosphoribosylamino)uracil reductase [Dysgonomonas sp. PFB1-18]|uniref:bifunctional diaminohydroxyphosphoribosylaminopyrimidine deaminase/5-amino-6-(5-phosphoribosylamino)uracil reductase RibD n=1 Tax=unclassified Dysgonomonas TaxID=2630389 RepID=UPI002474A074|nr:MULTISPECIES: bifunctional diaminohydroxyphosphoribosylaminopyrimidine deaminase/5-amino-6-(5-phosphoribosylamino)uracil reductase RibD [unclassified Dysgonomonas]MDH6308993.1 diaminohydroxyphosphoribosylaminopyrimidine deaminase/5-amino-6-(5-phosphoribosylamino)uracil reductase [Dysgonomonas sp. PF1-14]MDH6338744.1 diaminohydroxyphosphoribosylaminopyrimidine deaminase/5-amino-6-(5-phosphoribosylamino)uracil reductase [Dysgonomonas sp. PF1-16]MDH6380228.1 diaminohydroxyphosphoribosylaminopyri
MNIDEKYMYRCLQLALNGKGFVSPNPMVGAVVVHNGKIIGEGYHRRYGKAHAEVNAIDSVRDKSLLKESTIYVSLEPCSHHGKTPPCAQLIIDHQIPHVVVACLDPYPSVSGRGIKMLRDAGIEVKTGVLEKEAWELNKEFFTAQTKGRPYIYLKWAQTKDGFIDKERCENEDPKPTPISNEFSRILVHKKRAEVAAIMIGTNTAVKDNPSLTTRYWHGKNPIRIVLDRQGRVPRDYTIFDNKVETIVFTEQASSIAKGENVTEIEIQYDDNLLQNIFNILNSKRIDSVLVEGGRELLQSLIDRQLWDEAYIETSCITFGKGVKAPVIDGFVLEELDWGTSRQVHLKLFDNYKIL